MSCPRYLQHASTDNLLAPPARPPRPGASPSFKTSSPSPDRRKVSFQEGPPTEIEDSTRRNPPAGGKSSKWQPLATVEPSPVAENDPFSLGDSDDEKDSKPKEQTTVSDSEPSKKASVEAVSDEGTGLKEDTKPENASK